MLIAKIVLGLFGLGIVVFFHELGHFLAARLVGINVEAFSIGWGKPLLKKKIGSCEYRIGMFPLGGYCKMRGESDYSNEAYKKLEEGILPEKGSYLAASPQARILVSFAGPFFNLLLAVLLLSVYWGIGFEVNTFDNKIILLSEIESGQIFPADIAGLQTGDRILKVGKIKTDYFHEIRKNVALNPKKQLHLTIERNGEVLHTQITPSLQKKTGAGQIGILFWADPVVGQVLGDSPAQKAGLERGDKIISVNGEAVFNQADFQKIRSLNPDGLVLEYERGFHRGYIDLSGEDISGEIGFSWQTVNYRTPSLSVPAAIITGFKEGYETLIISVRSLKVLFMGIDLTEAVSGPVRITYMMGEVAAQGFKHGTATDIINFISLISIALCVMNLLPLPILDGGMIILFLVEMIRKKPIPPKAIAVFQTCGMVIIFGLLIFALYGDILFVAKGGH